MPSEIKPYFDVLPKVKKSIKKQKNINLSKEKMLNCYVMALNAVQFLQRWITNSKQEKCGFIEDCCGYHGSNIRATTKFRRK